jgi:hypothetical protein
VQKLKPYSVPLLIALSVICSILGFVFLDVHRDEAMIGEHAYWFSKTFSVKSTLARGLNGAWENHLWHYHKLLVYSGALVTSVFGFHLHALRLVPLLVYLAFTYFFIRYLIKKYDSQTKWIVAALVLLFFNFQFFTSGLVFRPEILITFFGFLSFIHLEKFRKDKSNLSLGFAALFVALAALSHLNGLAFGAAGLVYVLSISSWKKGAQFTLTAILCFIPYFWDLWSMDNIQAWMHTIAEDPNLAHQNNILLQLVTRVAEEHMRWFRNPQMAWFFLAFFLSIIASGKAFWKKNSALVAYTFTLLIVVAVLSYSKSTKYTIVYYPYMVLLMIAAAKNELSKDKRRVIRKMYLSVYLAINVGYAYFSFNRTSFDVLEQNKRIEKWVIEENANSILADESFIFSSIGKYKLHMPYVYSLLFDKIEKENELQSFLNFAAINHDDFVLIDKHRTGKNFYKKLHLEELKPMQIVGEYQWISAENDVHVFKHISQEVNER